MGIGAVSTGVDCAWFEIPFLATCMLNMRVCCKKVVMGMPDRCNHQGPVQVQPKAQGKHPIDEGDKGRHCHSGWAATVKVKGMMRSGKIFGIW